MVWVDQLNAESGPSKDKKCLNFAFRRWNYCKKIRVNATVRS